MQRAMKDSGIEWIGEIPLEWDVVPFKKILVRNDGGVWGNEPTGENDTLVLRSTEQTVEGEWDILSPAYRNLSSVSDINEYLVKCGDLLITKSSGSDFHIGKTTIADGYIESLCCSFSNFIQRLRVCSKMNSRYYWYILNSNIARAQFVYLQNSTSGIGNINSKNINEIKVPIPSFGTQDSIVNYLDRKCGQIDAIIARQQEVIEKLKAYKRSVITEAVTKGLNPNVPMKDSGVEWIGKIPADWTVVPLKRVATFSKGLPITKDDLTEHGVPVVSYGQIHSKTNSGTHLQDDLIRFVSETYFESNPSSLGRKGDIFFADTSEDYVGIGNAVLVDRDTPVFAGYHTIIVRPEEQSYSRYLAYLFLTDTWRSQLCSRASGIKVFSITQGLLKKTTVILPPVENVAAMTDYLDRTCEQVDVTVTQKQALIEKLKAYKKSLIYEVATGKKEVSNRCGLRGEVTEGLTGGPNPPLQTRCTHVAPTLCSRYTPVAPRIGQ